MELLPTEVNSYNPVVVVGKPRWLVSPKDGKTAVSVVLSVSSEAEKHHCIQHGLCVAGLRLRAVPYNTTTGRKPSTTK